ncbi:hypothetical protein P12x_002550 [Tundrisphaera lichenicola]|uniref:hypothetical protein n=1 Tax=Tundrisphaera lichenicola TaxID=2029860 RepID=UPI003EB9AA22
MAKIRVPYPGDPEQRRALFERAAAHLSRHGTYEGTPDGGTFRGTTPIGSLAGTYQSPAGSDVLEITLTHKPWLVPASLVEYEVRKFLEQA